MKRALKFGIISLAISALAISCAQDGEGENFQQDFVGVWNALETEGTNGNQSYTVEIVAGSSEDQIYFTDIYNISETSVEAILDGIDFDIPPQASKGIQFAGSGRANAAFDQITVNLTANDGTGDDVVKIILTK